MLQQTPLLDISQIKLSVLYEKTKMSKTLAILTDERSALTRSTYWILTKVMIMVVVKVSRKDSWAGRERTMGKKMSLILEAPKLA